jgi:2-polyprenyl-3-methyl-5-hydroxy-6-metoxy-1,4-benzoquinol methylase
MYNIAVHHPRFMDGTSFYRAMYPLMKLEKQFPEQFHVFNISDKDLDWTVLLKADLVMIGRPNGPYHRTMIKMCKEYGIPVWVDWDDHYHNIPDYNPRGKEYTEFWQDNIRWIAQNAQVVTVSTPKLYEVFSKWNSNVYSIPNAWDDDRFSLNKAEQYPRDKMILWRGSDTHGGDFEEYKDSYLKLFKKYDDFIWGFFGYWPQWAIDNLPADQIRLYQPTGPFEYLNMMFDIRPLMVHVPLVNNEFNHAKSNIAWMEATYVGARVLGPKFGEFANLPINHYEGKGSFMKNFQLCVENDDPYALTESRDKIRRNFRLRDANILRKRVIEMAIREFSPHYPSPDIDPPFSDKEFLEYNKVHGWTQTSEYWVKAQDELSNYFIETIAPRNVFEIGSGTGALLEQFINKGIVAYGCDLNKENKAFWDKRNPKKKDKFILDAAQAIKFEQNFDLVVSIEVLEHIPDDAVRQILENWLPRCKYFIMSSTPFHTSLTFDIQWGHINVKPTERWIELFKDVGYRYVKMIDRPTPWTLVFMGEYS